MCTAQREEILLWRWRDLFPAYYYLEPFGSVDLHTTAIDVLHAAGTEFFRFVGGFCCCEHCGCGGEVGVGGGEGLHVFDLDSVV